MYRYDARVLLAYACSDIYQLVGDVNQSVSVRYNPLSNYTANCGILINRCDGNLPACAACSSVYNTECVYDPNSDHRRKGVYKKDIDKLKTRNSTLEVLIQALLNVAEDEVPALVHQIRTCESLDSVADSLLSKEAGIQDEDQDLTVQATSVATPTFETQLSGQMGELRLEDGSTRYIGGTSNLLFLGSMGDNEAFMTDTETTERYPRQADAVVSWTNVTDDPSLVMHLVNMYFTWHYTYYTTLSKSLFWKEFLRGRQPSEVRHERVYCTPLLVNAMLALGCHFTAWPGARANPDDSATAGDHFFNVSRLPIYHLLTVTDSLIGSKAPYYGE